MSDFAALGQELHLRRGAARHEPAPRPTARSGRTGTTTGSASCSNESHRPRLCEDQQSSSPDRKPAICPGSACMSIGFAM
jgi:hypothetical protein